MLFVQVFIASGLVCLLAQVLLVNTKLGLIKVFIATVLAGVALTAFGLMGPIVGFGVAGIIINIFGVGEGLYGSIAAALNGDFIGLLKLIVLIVSILAVSSIFGVVKKIGPAKAGAPVVEPTAKNG